MNVVALLLLSVLTNTLSQLSLKRGVSAVGTSGGGSMGQGATLARLVANPFIAAWFLLMIPSMLLWLKAISMVELSFAYPFLSLNMVFISLGSVFFLREKISRKQWAGILLILLGIVLIGRS
jgi:drug/metabolite transporter (DMT)-like permease